MSAASRVLRGPQWDTVERKYLLKHPCCAVCGISACERNVHHKLPVSYLAVIDRMDLELDERNLITLCSVRPGNHHCDVGHLSWFSSFNPWLMTTVKMCKNMQSEEIRALDWFQQLVARRPKPASQLNSAELEALRKMAESTFSRLSKV